MYLKYREEYFLGPWPVSFVQRSISLCPYLRGSTIGGSTVFTYNQNCFITQKLCYM